MLKKIDFRISQNTEIFQEISDNQAAFISGGMEIPVPNPNIPGVNPTISIPNPNVIIPPNFPWTDLLNFPFPNSLNPI